MNARQVRNCSFLCLLVSACTSDMAPETTPPWPVFDLAIRSAPDGYHLGWTATGDDGNTGRASQYDIRYFAGDLRANWAAAQSAAPPPKPSNPGHRDSMTVSGIGEGPFEFGIKVADELGNWSRISNIVTASIDVTPPAAITDLSVRSTFQGFYLHWTAPSDNGMTGKADHYEIRYASSNLAANWNTSPVAPNAVGPAVAGRPDSASVLGIGIGPWEMGVKSVDASGNWSSLSNVVSTTIPEDAVPPGAVADLAVDMVTEGSVVLRWTASGDDGLSGQASAYDIRYSHDPITSDTWAGATKASSPAPRASGENELFAVPGLEAGQTYYLALRVLDEAEHLSDMSNSVSASISIPAQLTFDENYGFSAPDWSPNGESIAYTSYLYAQPDPAIYVIPAAGGVPVRYTSFSASGASWSPDGAKFAFSLYVDDKTRTVLGLMEATPEALPETLKDMSVKTTSGARWSPDGTEIAFVSSGYFIGETPVSDLYKIASSGGEPQRLYGGWSIGGIDWSPDGTQIVYASKQAGSFDLWVMSSSGGTGTQLTTSPGKEIAPAWSPDGRTIAFIGDDQVWVLYVAERLQTQITIKPNRNAGSKTSWSPDGTKVAFAASEPGSSHPISNIWIIAIR